MKLNCDSIDVYEQERLKELLLFENQGRNEGFNHIAGVDEAGRGPLAGPVVAAACIFPENYLIAGVNDSKKLTANQRDLLFHRLTTDPLICYSVAIVSSEIIDQINILQASLLAMANAVNLLSQSPDLVLVDGNKLLPNINSRCIVKGDSRSLSIGAASIIAKVTRDRIMVQLNEEFPQYGFDKHKGYGTAFHSRALELYGPCPHHRMSFAPVREASPQMELAF